MRLLIESEKVFFLGIIFVDESAIDVFGLKEGDSIINGVE
jgi:hypothetical protein